MKVSEIEGTPIRSHLYIKHLNIKGETTELFRPGFSKTWVLV